MAVWKGGFEALAGLLLTAILWLAERRSRPGKLFLLLIVGLAVERGVFDLVRGDAIWITDWVTLAQLAALFVAGTLVFALRRNSRFLPDEGIR